MIPKELMNMKPLRGDEKLERDSEYMGADDIDKGAEPVLTIKNAYRGKVTLQRGKEVKNVLTFVEERVPGISEVRPLIVNSGNRQVLKKLFGAVTADALEGKKIQLWIEHGVRNPAKNELTDGIRIRDKIPSGAKYAAPKCEACGKEITGLTGFTPEQIAATNKQRYGKALCVECGQKRRAEIEAEKAAQAAQSAPEAASDGKAEDGREKDMQAVLAALRGE